MRYENTLGATASTKDNGNPTATHPLYAASKSICHFCFNAILLLLQCVITAATGNVPSSQYAACKRGETYWFRNSGKSKPCIWPCLQPFQLPLLSSLLSLPCLHYLPPHTNLGERLTGSDIRQAQSILCMYPCPLTTVRPPLALPAALNKYAAPAQLTQRLHYLPP